MLRSRVFVWPQGIEERKQKLVLHILILGLKVFGQERR